MDKYEYKQLSERMIELMQNEEYGEAKEIADSIDWRRVRNAMMLANVSDIYEKTGEYQKSYDILQIAYHRAEGSRKVLYRLSSLALKTGNVDEAIDFYDEFVQLAPKDPNRHILRYQILRAQRAPLEQQIEALEEFKKAEYIEEWAFELAKLYQEAGMTAECLEECDDLILWFSEGKYVYKAMELKMQYKPLTPSQQEKYNRRFEKNGGETEEIPDLETYVAENEKPEDHLDEAATEHSEAVSEEPVEDIPESIGQQDTGKEESSEKPVRKPEKKKIGDTMRLDEALEQLLHRKPEVSAAEDEEPDISDLESAIGDIESVVDLDMVNQISQEKHTGDVPIGMKELIPGEVSEEAADKTERIPVEITTDITEDDAEELDLEDLVAEELPEEVEEAEPVEEEAEEVEEAEPIEETQTGTIEEELQKIADAEPAEPEEEIFDMEEAEDFLEDSPAEDWEDDTESFEEADAEELSFEEILSDWDSEEAEALLEDAEEEVYDESVEETYEEEPDEDEAEDILEDAEEEPIEESAEDVVEADAEEIYEEEPEDEVTEDTPILSPDIQRLIDEIEGAVPAEESLPEEKEIEKAPEEPHENMGEVTESLRLDDLPEEDEDLFEDEDFLESEDEEDEYESYEDDDSEEDEYESYEDDDSEEDEYESYEDDDSEEDEYESYEDDDSEEDEYESYEDDDSEEDEYESYEDDDSEDEYTSYDEDEYEDEIYDDEYEDDDEAYYEESDDDELADDEEFYYEDEEEPDEEPDEEDAPDFEDEFKVDPKHSEEPDDREIPDEDDGIDIMSATTPLSRKETAKLIATGKTSPLPLDEISDALSMDTGFVVHGRYDLETQSGIGTRAGLTEEQKKLFSYFVPVRGMSEQLVDVLEQDKNCTNRKGTSKTGNLLIIGDKGNGKTVLAVDVVKAIQKQREIRQGKVAIVTGESLNKKKIGDIFDKLYGGALIIEKAG